MSPIIKETLRLDTHNNNNRWRDLIDLEIKMLFDFETFHMLENDEDLPERYKWTPCHCVCDAKFDGRLKPGLVAEGHMTK